MSAGTILLPGGGQRSQKRDDTSRDPDAALLAVIFPWIICSVGGELGFLLKKKQQLGVAALL